MVSNYENLSVCSTITSTKLAPKRPATYLDSRVDVMEHLFVVVYQRVLLLHKDALFLFEHLSRLGRVLFALLVQGLVLFLDCSVLAFEPLVPVTFAHEPVSNMARQLLSQFVQISLVYLASWSEDFRVLFAAARQQALVNRLGEMPSFLIIQFEWSAWSSVSKNHE